MLDFLELFHQSHKNHVKIAKYSELNKNTNSNFLKYTELSALIFAVNTYLDLEKQYSSLYHTYCNVLAIHVGYNTVNMFTYSFLWVFLKHSRRSGGSPSQNRQNVVTLFDFFEAIVLPRQADNT
uniref:Uncharacterized protein n=1 Tax=Glossina austeni TaxID=7395 RepID=A0A1A9VAN5_GLOAU